MAPGNLEILVDASVRGGWNVRRWYHSSVLYALLFQAWAWTANAFHPFARRNSSDDGVTAGYHGTNQVPSLSTHHPVFGEHWAKYFEAGSHGCESGRGSFM